MNQSRICGKTKEEKELDIVLVERHTRIPQPAQIEFRPAAMQVVESRHLRLWTASFEGQRDTGSHETGPPVTRMR